MNDKEKNTFRFEITNIPGEVKRTSPKFNQFKLEYGDWAGDINIFTEKLHEPRTFAISVKEGITRDDATIGFIDSWDESTKEVDMVMDEDFDPELFETKVTPMFLNLGEDYELQYFALIKKPVDEEA